jgi:hypothetical protein
MSAFAFVVAVSVFRFRFDFNSSDLGGACKRKDTASGSKNELHFSCVDDDRVTGIPVVNGSITRIAIATVVIVITVRSKNMKDGLQVMVSRMCGTGTECRIIDIEVSIKCTLQSCYL